MMLLRCPECGTVRRGVRGLFFHLVGEHKIDRHEAYDLAGDAMQVPEGRQPGEYPGPLFGREPEDFPEQ